MALPPEPIEEILPQATYIVLARVMKILHTDKQQPVHREDPRIIGMLRELPAQRLQLEILESIAGEKLEKNTILDVLKPAGDYVLRQDVEGPFLLMKEEDGSLKIIGRYGPDTYSLKEIQNFLASLDSTK